MTARALLLLCALGAALGLIVALVSARRRDEAEARLAQLRIERRSLAAESTRPVVAGTPSPTPKRIETSGVARGTTAQEPIKAKAGRRDVGEILAADPELRKAYESATLARLRNRYGRLFERWRVPPDQVERAFTVMMRDEENEMDLALAAEALAVPRDDPALTRYRRGDTAVTAAALEAALGAQAYRAFQDYERAGAMRTTAADVASLAAAANIPLSGAQTEQLMITLAEASASYREGKLPQWANTDWDAVLTKAARYLSAEQLAVVRAKAEHAKAVGLLAEFYAGRRGR